MMFDCGFTRDNCWFRYRTAGIIVENGCVLFAGNEKNDYLYSVGGAVKMGESAEQAVVREISEETGVKYEIDRLAVIHENFFYENNGTSQQLNCHEICLYFLMKPRGTQALNSNSYTQGCRENMYWIPIKDLKKYKAFPTFMADYLAGEHREIVHIVTDERVG
ncbi:MAG TPA: NUDIX domain-containing protein [Candidatus Limihabitans stercoravium]|nr:NUDIX domain-containing protein [Candidatus Limihabitans stercoravium]